jgi:hypothetical protein
MLRSVTVTVLALTTLVCPPLRADEFREFSSRGLRGSADLDVRVQHPASWKKVETDDEMALVELRGPQGALTGILQIGRGRRQRTDMEALCHPERARTMLQNPGVQQPDTRITDVVARTTAGRAGYEVRYERNNPPDFLLVRSAIVCLKDSRLVVSCGASGERRSALAAIEPVCAQVLDSLRITED